MKILPIIAAIMFISLFGSFFLPLVLAMFIIFSLAMVAGNYYD
jgi:hypothetical protein